MQYATNTSSKSVVKHCKARFIGTKNLYPLMGEFLVHKFVNYSITKYIKF